MAPTQTTPTILAEISRADLLNLSIPPSASITDVKHLSSYNWIEAPTPTIAVPGSPPLWSPPRAPQQLKKDSGLVYIAQNAARHPDSPLEPLFRALYIANPSFDIRSIDVVTDRNIIRKLLSFINPSSTRNGLEPFTFNIEIAKDTAIFSRVETATHEIIKPHEFRGFGHEFEKVYTTTQINGSTGHHRIISYRFGDLNFIVRHETDGYLGATPPSHSKAPESDNLLRLLGSLSLSPTTPKLTSAASKLSIKPSGQPIPLASTLEIKTRVRHKPLNIEEIAPQLWVSQTPKLVRAYHHNGRFQRVEVEDVAAMIKGWEGRNQVDLRKLAALISRIVGVVRVRGGGAVVRYDVGRDKLVVSKADGKKILPGDLYSKWDDRDESGAESDREHDAAAESAGDRVETEKEGKSPVFGPGDGKGEEDAKPAREGERRLPDHGIPKPTPAKDTESGL